MRANGSLSESGSYLLESRACRVINGFESVCYSSRARGFVHLPIAYLLDIEHRNTGKNESTFRDVYESRACRSWNAHFLSAPRAKIILTAPTAPFTPSLPLLPRTHLIICSCSPEFIEQDAMCDKWKLRRCRVKTRDPLLPRDIYGPAPRTSC